MINDFLATLDNDPIAPAGIVWPSFTARTPSLVEAPVRIALIGAGLSREHKFARCLQLAYLVEESPLVDFVRARDKRVTYAKKAIRNRFALSGSIVVYTGSNVSHGILNLVLNSTTPPISAWDVVAVNSTHVQITDDLGRTVTQTVSFSGGQTGVIAAPAGTASFILTGAAPAAGDSWSVSYQAAGASWLPLALARLALVNPAGLLSPDLSTWYHKAPTQLDRLAAVVAALGSC